MELFLNLAGALAAVALIFLWLWSERSGSVTGTSRKAQLVALVLLILIVFPVISVTDDLLAAAKPAETDVLSRRDHESSGLIAAIPAVLRPGESALPEPLSNPSRLIASLDRQTLLPDAAALAPIENRPPPAL